MKLSITRLQRPFDGYFLLLGPNILLNSFFSNTLAHVNQQTKLYLCVFLSLYILNNVSKSEVMCICNMIFGMRNC
jgi:hypothetical protein